MRGNRPKCCTCRSLALAGLHCTAWSNFLHYEQFFVKMSKFDMSFLENRCCTGPIRTDIEVELQILDVIKIR
jgi:hypothetical protein